jgi:hypothetical protein
MSLSKKLRRRGASAFLKDNGYPVAESTLAKYATIGGGPPFESFGRIPLYDPDELLSWARSRCRVRRSTSDPGSPVPAQPEAA